MKPLRTLIVDDVRLIRVELKMILSDYSEIEVIGEASNVREAKYMISELKPDVVFLDIQLPGPSGFDLLDQLEVNFKLVFISSYFDQYYEKAKKYNPVDFLTKPISKEKLVTAIGKLSPKIKQKYKVIN